MAANPFTLGFGKRPYTFISRTSEIQSVINDFNEENSASQSYLITGVRGSGKTVTMTAIANSLRESGDWIVINLNPNRDLLESLVAKLYDIPELHQLFIKAKFNLTLFGIGAAIENVPPINDIEVALEKMLAQVKLLDKKVLVTIDEVTKTETMKIFTSSFQLLIREDYPIFLLMTGLYENIYELQNDATLTFLYRSPRLDLAPLDKISIKKRYREIFNLTDEKAIDMANLTAGYSFAFQTLGYLCWKNRNYLDNRKALLEAYDETLQSYVYQKIWSELSDQDKKVLTVLSKHSKIRTKDLREALKFTPSLMSVYRERLKRKGLINTSEYGHISLTLPRLSNFILEYEGLE
ncbi:ATP-binding protein [Streptococcus dentasini]